MIPYSTLSVHLAFNMNRHKPSGAQNKKKKLKVEQLSSTLKDSLFKFGITKVDGGEKLVGDDNNQSQSGPSSSLAIQDLAEGKNLRLT